MRNTPAVDFPVNRAVARNGPLQSARNLQRQHGHRPMDQPADQPGMRSVVPKHSVRPFDPCKDVQPLRVADHITPTDSPKSASQHSAGQTNGQLAKVAIDGALLAVNLGMKGGGLGHATDRECAQDGGALIVLFHRGGGEVISGNYAVSMTCRNFIACAAKGKFAAAPAAFSVTLTFDALTCAKFSVRSANSGVQGAADFVRPKTGFKADRE